METRKLYYEDCHLRTFSAAVLTCEAVETGWEVTLDATAFYPEGGGQACDLGKLGDANVLDVQERGEEVVHLCDAPLPPGETVAGEIDYARRFHLMQQHAGEHILSCIVHRRYGWHNTGFHMGAEGITVDFDGVIPPEDLADIELEVNRAVWADVPIRCWIPSPEELPNVTYRTKRTLPWPVRIVEIPGYDSCACCGIHVGRTGEIGVVKIFSMVGFRGGSRLEMACGGHAFALMNTAFAQNRQVSQAFSAKWQETGVAARRVNEVLEGQKQQITRLQRRVFAYISESYVNHGDVVHFEEDLEPVQIRELADAIADRCGGMAAVFSGSDDRGYGYCLATREGDLRRLCKALNQRLSGRGGGKPNFQQGSLSAKAEDVLSFFKEWGKE